jgi:SAM-dependent methyltransferase
MRESSVDWEKDIYGKGKQVNRYPYDEVVSLFLRTFSPELRSLTRVLELGCGTGNNIAFLLENGFLAEGLDYSTSAIELGNSLLAKQGLSPSLRVGNLAHLDYESDYFDVVLDRGCITQNSYEEIEKILSQVYRVLKPSGLIASFTLFGLDHPDMLFGKVISRNCRDFFVDGYFKNVGLTSFFSFQDIFSLFGKFQIVEARKNTVTDFEERILSQTYSVLGSKPKEK